MKVAVLDPQLIPNLVDVVIGEYVYELQFHVEEELISSEPEVIDMDAPMDEAPKGDDDPKENTEPEKMDDDGNKNENQSNEKGPEQRLMGSGTSNARQQTSNVPQQTIKGDTGSLMKPAVVLSPSGVSTDGSALWKANIMPKEMNSGYLNKTRMLNDGTVSPMRASKRNTSVSDQDSLEKASKLKARKNLDTPLDKGKEPKTFSFNALDDSSFLATTNSLGVRLGNNEQEIALSIKLFKDLESTRISEAEQRVGNTKIDLDEAVSVSSIDDNLDLEALNLICADVSQGLGDGGCDPLCLQPPVSQNRKASNKKRNKSRS